MATKPSIAPDKTSAEPTTPAARAAPDVQRLWFTLSQRSWKFLVVMPAHARGNVAAMTESLAQVGSQHRGTPVRFLNAHNVDVGGTGHILAQAISENPAEGGTLLAVDSPLLNPASIPLALAADGVVLVVELGETDVDSAKRTIETVGRDRILGTVTVTPRNKLGSGSGSAL